MSARDDERYNEPEDGFEGVPRPLLVQLPEPLRELARRGVMRRYRKGTLIIDEGTHGDGLYILLQGSVRVFSSAFDDRKMVTFATDHAGDYFGDMSLDGGPRSASVEALETTLCSLVTAHTVWRYVAESPDFTRMLIERLIKRARTTTDRMREIALLDTYPRLARVLDSMAGPARADGSRVIQQRVTHEALAGQIGCSRVMVSRLMKDLQRGEYVATEESRIVLLRKLPPRW